MQFIRRSESTVPLSAGQVIFSLVSHKALRWMSPAFAACAFASAIFLSHTGPLYAAAAASQGAVLALALAGCVPVLRKSSVVAIAHYFCLLQAAAAVGFIRGLAGRQSVLWQRFARLHAPAAEGIRP
jgi:hypothetical protein